MTRLQVLTAAALSWPLTIIYYRIPGSCDFPCFFTLLCLAVIYFMDAEKDGMTEDEFIGILRTHAFECCKIKGSVTTDDLRKIAERSNMSAPTPQTWSKILKRPLFVRTGEVISPTYRHKIGVYKLAGGLR